jgi:pre-mRNA-processing factor 19
MGTARRIHLVKQWDELAVLEQHTGPVTGVAWGPNASYLASTSMDRHLSFFGTRA